MDRVILHCDCNCFFASVECALNPLLCDVPMAVGGNRSERHGIILAKNELAKKYDIKTAETVGSALRKCPELVIVPPHHDIYEEYSLRVNKIYREYTDLVEKFGIDESWLDVTGSIKLFGDGKTIADTLRRRIREEIGITVSVGVSFNKIFAKLGSDLKKPDATTVLSKENFKDKIYGLPADMLLFVGKSTYTNISRIGIRTIGDIAMAGEGLMTSRLGKMGTQLYRYAAGLDDSPVASAFSERQVKSVSNGITFFRDLCTSDEIRTGVYALSENVSARLRYHGLKCTTVQVTIRDPDFVTINRQKSVSPTSTTHEIAQSAIELISENYPPKKPIRMLTVAGCGVCSADSPTQLSMFDSADVSEKHERLENAIDSIRGKFGTKGVFRAGTMNKLGKKS